MFALAAARSRQASLRCLLRSGLAVRPNSCRVDITYVPVHYKSMESPEQPPRLHPLHDLLQRLPRVQWLGTLLRPRIGQGSERVSGDNGKGLQPEGNGQPRNSASPATERRRFIERTVADALAHAQELAEQEAGGSKGRICPPLLAGPQRYRDPSIWGPNYGLLASTDTETPEQIDTLQNTPLHRDERYQNVARLTYERAIQLGLPGAPSQPSAE